MTALQLNNLKVMNLLNGSDSLADIINLVSNIDVTGNTPAGTLQTAIEALVVGTDTLQAAKTLVDKLASALGQPVADVAP